MKTIKYFKLTYCTDKLYHATAFALPSFSQWPTSADEMATHPIAHNDSNLGGFTWTLALTLWSRSNFDASEYLHEAQTQDVVQLQERDELDHHFG